MIIHKHANALVPSDVENSPNIRFENIFIDNSSGNPIDTNTVGGHWRNIITTPNNGGEILLREDSGVPGFTDNVMDHCTLSQVIRLNVESGNPTNNTFKNNIYRKTLVAEYDPIFSDYNLFELTNDQATYDGVTNRNLSQWQAAKPLDLNSIDGAATFNNPSLSDIGYFALQAGSLGKSAGNDGNDMGADTAQIVVTA